MRLHTLKVMAKNYFYYASCTHWTFQFYAHKKLSAFLLILQNSSMRYCLHTRSGIESMKVIPVYLPTNSTLMNIVKGNIKLRL